MARLSAIRGRRPSKNLLQIAEALPFAFRQNRNPTRLLGTDETAITVAHGITGTAVAGECGARRPAVCGAASI